jgi:glucokinase
LSNSLYLPAQNAPYALGAIDIGGTKIEVALISKDGDIRGRKTIPTVDIHDPIVDITDALKICEAELGLIMGGIGIGCTGPVDPITGIVGKVDLLPNWEGLNLIEGLKQAFKVPVALENDADAAALAEWQWGSGKGTSSFIYVTVSTGIGAGLILKDRLYRGVNGVHPELGHQTLDPSGPDCYCGAKGCWESLASGLALEAWARQQNPKAGTLKDIFDQARLGDAFSLSVTHRAAHYMGLGLANLVTSFCPEVIALGGGVTKGADLWLKRALEVARQRCGLVPFKNVLITEAKLQADVALAGAAAAYWHQFSNLRS